MELPEALEEAKKGKKIRRRGWDVYIKYSTELGIYKMHTMTASIYTYDLSILSSNDWIVFSENKDATIGPISFIDALKLLREGYKARLSSWTNTTYLMVEGATSLLLFTEEEINFIPSFYCLISYDWETID